MTKRDSAKEMYAYVSAVRKQNAKVTGLVCPKKAPRGGNRCQQPALVQLSRIRVCLDGRVKESEEAMNDLYSFALLAAIVIACVALAKRARRRKIGPAGVGALYGLLSEDQRQAVEMIVEDKAESRDPEHADDKPQPKP